MGLGIGSDDLNEIPAEILRPSGADTETAEALAYVSDNIIDPESGVIVSEVKREGIFFRVELRLSTGQTLTFYLTKENGEFKPASMDVDTDIDDGRIFCPGVGCRQQNAKQPSGQKAKRSRCALY